MKKKLTYLLILSLSCAPVQMVGEKPYRKPMPLEKLIQVGITLIHEYWSVQLPKMGKKYRPPQRVNAYTRSRPVQTGCGQSIPNNAFYCPSDHSISYDVDFLRQIYTKIGDYAVVAVLAHEWGHLIQNHLYPSRNSFYTIQMELQADALAGAFTKYAINRRVLEKGDLEESVAGIYSVGDNLPWYEEGAHGKPEQRVKAFLKGVKNGIKGCFE